jgi:hypothetical protein
VHVRGLDNLSTAEVKAYAYEHFSLDDNFDRVEWVDDTSANLIFTSTEAASLALTALTDPSVLQAVNGEISPLQLRPARRFSKNPHTELFTRIGTTIDVKRKGAADASRYYLLNPGQDPRERRRHERPNNDGDYNRRRYDDSEHKRRRNDASFDVDMYDDDASPKRPRSRARTRNRSASPGRHGGYSRLRSSSPLRKNKGKELFADRSTSRSNATKELFPTGTSHAKDLLTNSTTTFPSPAASLPAQNDFPTRNTQTPLANKRGSMGGHRRSDAIDNSGSRSLADRITGADNNNNNSSPSSRSLADRITGRANTNDLRIRGAAERAGEFNIKGAASGGGGLVKELFPLKAGGGGANAGKELFGEKIKGRGAPRRKAEDMFG